MSSFFGGGQTSQKDRVKKWMHDLNAEKRALQRDVNALKREEMKLKNELKKEAKKGNAKACRILAKSIVKSQQMQERLVTAQVQINSICLHLKTQSATLQVSSIINKSSQLLQYMNQLQSLPQLRQISTQMQKEMIKTGLIEDAFEDALSVTDDSELDELAENEADAVLYEITEGQLGVAGPLKQRKTELTAIELKDEEENMQAGMDKLNV